MSSCRILCRHAALDGAIPHLDVAFPHFSGAMPHFSVAMSLFSEWLSRAIFIICIEWGTLRFWGFRMKINSDLESSHDADYEYAI